MTNHELLAEIDEIVRENPSYRIGGDGSDGTCDCIGLIMGAMHRQDGKTFPLHSTNYFSRKEMDTLESKEDAVLLPGMAVYKARPDTGQLHKRYKAGGEYYNEDTQDYYHVGVIRKTKPLEIVHCTSGGGVDGITTDTRLSNWTHVGRIRGVEYVESMPETGQPVSTADRLAVVTSADGNPVKLRRTPSTHLDYIAKITVGTVVQITEEAQGWAHVIADDKIGYMMSEFLAPAGGAVPMTQTEMLQKLLEDVSWIRQQMEQKR